MYSLARRSSSPVNPVVLSAGRPLPIRLLRRRGVGDVLSDAQTALRNAGYEGATCRTERVSLPMADPTTGRNYYDQNICSAPGFTGGFMADVVARGGVDLAAERAYNIAQGGGRGTSYFDGIGTASTPIRYAGVGVEIPAYDPLPPARRTNGGTDATAARAVSVSLENTSRPGLPLQVGDNWTLRVSGSPNSPVTGSAKQNGRDLGASSYGSTDSQGLLVIRGVMAATDAGSWSERWTVNGMSADITFSVLERQPTKTPNTLDTGSSAGSGSGSGSSGSGTKTGGSGSSFSFDLSGLSLSSPLVWGSALALGLVVFGGKR